ncbi:MAG: flavin reductase family protein [Pigmentiphaga sp.]|uniref:flavin reductase family protein n=1 Tax=Pigmentiphaga sp. TaxID=1977564 RepID=UPI0029AEBD0F|nr:flavin reductase family protein [Pigmentiphaga sp.]MDX3906756.1 flavin reductase family protein [Pigmentiphaga sp.]
MDTEFHFYEPRNGHGLRHDPLNSIVAPRPIGWISTQSADGCNNLAPYSFFNLFNYRPPIIGFASTGWKDSVRNIDATGEFVWNLVTRPLAEAMNETTREVGPEVDEFVLGGLTPAPSRLVRPPRVLESPVAFECRMTELIQLGGVDGVKVDSWLVLGEVVAIHIAKPLVAGGVYDTAAARPILRGGGRGDYFEITAAQRFLMARPG